MDDNFILWMANKAKIAICLKNQCGVKGHCPFYQKGHSCINLTADQKLLILMKFYESESI